MLSMGPITSASSGDGADGRLGGALETSTAVARGDGEGRDDLLSGLHEVDEGLAVTQGSATAFVDHVRCIDELAVVGDQPARTVAASSLLVCGERDDDVALGHVPFALETN